MIRWNKLLLIIIGLSVPFLSHSQENLLDYSNSLKFAQYLSTTQQYTLASQEYERINFLWPKNTEVVFELFRNYRLSDQCNKFDLCYELYSANDSIRNNQKFSKELLRFSLNCKLTGDKYFQLLEPLNPNEKTFYTFGYHWVNNDFDSVRNLFQNEKENLNRINPQLYDITKSFNEQKYKKPWLAALMSSVIPGSGKAYSKKWGDAIVSLLFVGTNTFVSYRAFHKKGISSVNGWVFGSLAFSFYSANIWGSAKAAKNYNQNLINTYQQNAEQVIYNSY